MCHLQNTCIMIPYNEWQLFVLYFIDIKCGLKLWIKRENYKHHNTDDQCHENVKFYIKLQLQKTVLRETNSSQRSKISASFAFLLIVLSSPTNETHIIMFKLGFWLTWTAKSLLFVVYCAYPGWQDILSKFFKSMYKGILQK
jgi:hypothetical protein